MDKSNSEDASASSENRPQDYLIPVLSPPTQKKRSQPGHPDPDAEVVALSPKSIIATNRYVCETCNKGFQRDQNLQLHKRGHNMPWKLIKGEDANSKNSSKKMVMMKKKKRVYVCPETSCVHHHPSRALGDLTGIKKHYFRKHGEKKWMCEKCNKCYAVHSDWKAHVKTCGTREYRCHCGILFPRKDSFITHRAFCDALAEESAKLIASTSTAPPPPPPPSPPPFFFPFSATTWDLLNPNPNLNLNPSPNLNLNPSPNPNPNTLFHVKPDNINSSHPIHPYPTTLSPPHLSPTTLILKASSMGPTITSACHAEHLVGPSCCPGVLPTWQRGDRLTRDFLGVAAGEEEEEEEGLTMLTNFGFGFPTEDECPCLL